MNGLSGFALAGYLNDLERERKKAYSAVDTLNKESDASDQYQSAKRRTEDWLASLSPEDLSKINPEVRNMSSSFEGVGDVSNFDSTKRANELGLTSKYAGVEGIDEYLKSMNKAKEEKKYNDETAAIEEATRGIQRQNKFSDLNALEDLVGMKKGDYNIMSNRDVAVNSGIPKFSGSDRAKDFMSTYVEKPEDLASKGKDAAVAPGQLRKGNLAGLIEDYRRPEMKDFVKKKLQEFKNNTGFDENIFQTKLDAIDAGEGYVVSKFIDDYYSQGQKNNQRVDLENKLIEPRTKTKASTTTAGLQATKDEGAILSETAAERLGDFDASISQMGELLAGLNNPDAPQGPIAQWKKINPYDWQAQGKQQLVAATKQLIGKALEGGVLRKEDEEKYAKILPTMGDTYESAKLKTEQLGAMLNNAYTAKRTALKNAGYDVTKFSGGVKVGEKPGLPPNYDPNLASKAGASITEGNKIVDVKSDDDYNKLPSGALFKGPDGRTRRKP